METITFTSNWNSKGIGFPDKLDLKTFTTLRLRNDNKYITGNSYKIIKKEGKKTIEKGSASIFRIYHFLIENLTDYVAFLDTGYSKEECTEIIKRMYKNYEPPINWSVREISLILFCYNLNKPL